MREKVRKSVGREFNAVEPERRRMETETSRSGGKMDGWRMESWQSIQWQDWNMEDLLNAEVHHSMVARGRHTSSPVSTLPTQKHAASCRNRLQIQLEATHRWSAICRVWPWTLTYQKFLCAFLARVKTYTHTKN